MTISKTKYSEPDGLKSAFESSSGTKEIVPVYESPLIEDSIEDEIKERFTSGESITEIMQDLIKVELEAKKREYYNSVLVKILSLIADSKNPQLDIEVLIAASGLTLREGVSHSSIAAKYGITRAAFSARLRKVIDDLGLSNPRACKSLESIKEYKLTNKSKSKQSK